MQLGPVTSQGLLQKKDSTYCKQLHHFRCIHRSCQEGSETAAGGSGLARGLGTPPALTVGFCFVGVMQRREKLERMWKGCINV